MPFSPDGLPLIGEIGGTGVHVLSGLGGSGFMSGPMAGLLLAHMMASPNPVLRAQLRRVLAPTSPSRFFYIL